MEGGTQRGYAEEYMLRGYAEGVHGDGVHGGGMQRGYAEGYMDSDKHYMWLIGLRTLKVLHCLSLVTIGCPLATINLVR